LPGCSGNGLRYLAYDLLSHRRNKLLLGAQSEELRWRVFKLLAPTLFARRGSITVSSSNSVAGLSFRTPLSKTGTATAGTAIYDFSARLKENSREQRFKEIENENVLLARVLAETRTEIVRLRKVLAAF
jgi:hypothetical protein